MSKYTKGKMKFADIKPIPGYEALEEVLCAAYLQAAVGKGAERHADDKPFPEQPMLRISQNLASVDGLLYQVAKKLQESRGLPDGRRQAEVLGAIVYSAGVHIAYDTWFSNAKADDAPKPEGDDWIEWHGGECPVPAGTLVDVQYKDGQRATGIPAMEIAKNNPRSAVVWRHYEGPTNIVLYRLHKTQPQPAADPLVTDSEMAALMGGAMEQESQQLAGYGPWFVLAKDFNHQPPATKGKRGAVILTKRPSIIHDDIDLDDLDWTIPSGLDGRITAYCIAENQTDANAT